MSNIYKDWTIEVTQRIEDNKHKGAWIVDVRATKGERTEERNFHRIISQLMLTQVVKVWIDNIESADAVTDSVDFAEPTPEPPAPPTAAELALIEWQKDRSLLVQLNELVRIGVFTGTETQITNLRTKVRNGFKVEYLE